MPKYYPIQDLENFKYEQATAKTTIKSALQVDLSANETIEIQDPVLINPYTYYLELYVKTGGGHTSDYTWQDTCYIEICRDTMYDPATTPTLADKQTKVRNGIMDLLDSYGSSTYIVIAAVTRPDVLNSNKTESDISAGSGVVIN